MYPDIHIPDVNQGIIQGAMAKEDVDIDEGMKL